MKRYLQNRKDASSYNPFHDIWIVRMYVKYIRSVISRIGELSSDDELMKTYKHESVLLVLLLCVIAGVNAIIYWLFQLPVFISNISLIYIAVNLVIIAVFHLTKNYSFFYTTYGFLAILFVGFMSVVLGGIQESGFIIILGIIIPMSITVSSNIITGGIWALIYTMMIIIVTLHSVVGIFRIPWNIHSLLGWKSTLLLIQSKKK